MTETPNLALPFIAAAQAQKHVTHNEALLKLDVLVQLAVEDRHLAGPPSSPAEGAAWIVASPATGAWTGHEQEVAAFQDGAWAFLTPRIGWQAYARDEALRVTWTGTAWTAPVGGSGVVAGSSHGATTGFAIVEEDITLTGASVTSGIVIPDRAIVLAVTERVTEAVTGATSFSVGLAGEPTKFGNLLSVALGSHNIGVIGPTAFYADTALLITANGGAFTGGKLRAAIHYAHFDAASP
ncbi:DUF2793 domain-containing protein [Chelatococcus asaccharovorans]|uniref:Uncharacterized protein DUF2793 n=1 Tax=Chelatococcus asaccharovorans TaxID=28210 RepID=A0A2V3U2Q1_9HYPH|nr:DUF2793 domain-containing protein [Chelatococcus asaccharovorans]MBS7702526.1 DUF2793 domain-containing protein [Chelatococcus asaccharovorans]PXW56264.1 uncharacterized protein DUF2793 [Chelatococcus asaccharovorans]CAH1671203.1 conserved hypothetical protein [Chelatococcus asaccharovorans]CAH1677352.1 conserved hypothetical protein [Chelatococcus asaccharovorans]